MRDTSLSSFARPFLLLTIGALLVTGCSMSAGLGGGSSAGGSGEGPTGSPPTDPEAPVTNDPGAIDELPSGDGATPVEPEPGIINAIPHAIDRVSVSPDGRTLTVYYWGGVEACYGLKEVRTEVDDEGLLHITVLEGTKAAAADQACIDIAMLKAATVTLDEPILVDDSTVE